MNAIEVVDNQVSFTPEKCIGCGVCVYKCPKEALYLVHREGEQDYSATPQETASRMLSERGHNPTETFKNNYWR